MEGLTDVRSYGRTVAKTKFSRIDGLPYFLNYGAPRARLRRNVLLVSLYVLLFKEIIVAVQ